MKREIRIIISIIVLLVGLIFAVLFKPSAPSSEIKCQAEVAIENVTTPDYGKTVSYTLPVSKRSVLAKNEPPLPTPEKFLPVPKESQKAKRTQTPESRTLQRDAIPDLPENFPDETDSRQAKLPKRVHTVVDGDTLQNIAFRYLDSELRWREIYQANRGRLKDPTALPIGAKLTIPPRAPTPKHASNSGTFSHSTERQASRPISHQVAKPVEPPIDTPLHGPLVPFER